MEQSHLEGEVIKKLETNGSNGWRIYIKRVNIVKCDGVNDNLEVFL